MNNHLKAGNELALEYIKNQISKQVRILNTPEEAGTKDVPAYIRSSPDKGAGQGASKIVNLVYELIHSGIYLLTD